MKMIILHYRVIQGQKQFCNNTIRQEIYLSKPEARTALVKQPNTPNKLKGTEKRTIIE